MLIGVVVDDLAGVVQFGLFLLVFDVEEELVVGGDVFEHADVAVFALTVAERYGGAGFVLTVVVVGQELAAKVMEHSLHRAMKLECVLIKLGQKTGQKSVKKWVINQVMR